MRKLTLSMTLLLAAAALASPALAQLNCVDDVVQPTIERPRADHVISYDSARQVIVMVGGTGDYEDSQRETWEFDGTRWRFKGFTPFGTRLKAGMVYDAARSQTVFFGGADPADPQPGTAYTHRGDTWSWNGSTWTQRATTGPAGRSDMSIAYDSQRQRIVMFGGADNVQSMGDTWEWNGTAWSLRATNGPPADYGTEMVYDSNRHVCVLMGGSQSMGTTWEWNGSSWIDHPTATNISGRHSHTMCFDPVRNKVIVYGGQSSLAETWEYDGIDWTLRTQESTPGIRRDSPMAFHVGIGRTVMFGGLISLHAGGVTWFYDGTAWTLLPESGDYGNLGERAGACAVQVTSGAGGQAVLFGGSTSDGLSNETWNFLDEYGWIPLRTAPQSTPPARRLAGLCLEYFG